MKRLIIFALSTVSLTAVAMGVGASQHDYPHQNAQERWLSPQQIQDQLTQMGYQVRRLEADDGCIEAYVTDRHGARGELYLDPTTGMPGCQEESQEHGS